MIWRARAAPVEEKKRRPAVIDGELVYTSPSAIQKFLSCESQWYFRYVLGLPDSPPGKAQKRGIDGHKRIQTYLEGGPDVLDRLERLGLKYMPAPGADLLCEKPVEKVTAQGVPIVGYIDLLNPRRAHEGVVDVTDWKFKSELARAARPEQLIDPAHEAGVQMLGYGADATLRFPEIDAVRLAHVTFQTYSTADCDESAIEVGVDKIRAGWETVTSAAIPGMRRAARAKSHVEVSKNEKVCHKYRKPCPYIGTCLDRMARLTHGFKHHTGDQKMGMLSELTGGAQPSVPIQTKSAMAIQDVAAGEVKAKDATQGGKYTVEGVPCQYLCCTAMGGQSYASFVPLAGGAPKLVSPDLIVTEIKAPVAPIVVPPDAPKSDPALAAKPLAPAAAAAEPEAPKKRGRPAKPPETPAVPAAAVAAQSPPVPPAAPAQTVAAPVVGGMEGVHLYFGCAPLGVALQSLTPYVEAIEALLKKEAQLNIPDLRTANDKAFGFGMWKGYLAKIALEQPPTPGHYRVTMGDEREDVIAKALAAIAKPGHAVFA